MKTGLFVSLMRSIFLNLSAMAKLKNHPTKSFATSLIDLKGDMRMRAAGFLWLATYVAGDDPIDLPKTIMSEGDTPRFSVR
jgi:hypothetical protein